MGFEPTRERNPLPVFKTGALTTRPPFQALRRDLGQYQARYANRQAARVRELAIADPAVATLLGQPPLHRRRVVAALWDAAKSVSGTGRYGPVRGRCNFRRETFPAHNGAFISPRKTTRKKEQWSAFGPQEQYLSRCAWRGPLCVPSRTGRECPLRSREMNSRPTMKSAKTMAETRLPAAIGAAMKAKAGQVENAAAFLYHVSPVLVRFRLRPNPVMLCGNGKHCAREPSAPSGGQRAGVRAIVADVGRSGSHRQCDWGMSGHDAAARGGAPSVPLAWC